jgi:CDP-diacylglycerol--glycerol-3-phosphate 3-phosphatidyltransferase
MHKIRQHKGALIVKYIPNALSVARFPLALSLIIWALFISPNLRLGDTLKWVFTACYLFSGLTDILDGYLARKYHWESKLGGILDGLADVTFFLCCFVVLTLLYARRNLVMNSLDLNVLLVTGAVIIVFKTANFFVTLKRFKQFNGVHTWTFKSVGTMLFFSALAFMWLQRLDYRMVIFMGAVTILACVEELWLLFVMKEYDVDHPGLLVEYIRKKKGKA